MVAVVANVAVAALPPIDKAAAVPVKLVPGPLNSVVAVIVVPRTVVAVVAPIVVPLIAPPLTAAVVNTAEFRVTTPVVSAIEPAAVPSLALRFMTSRLVASTKDAVTSFASTVVNTPLEGVVAPMLVLLIVLVTIALPESVTGISALTISLKAGVPPEVLGEANIRLGS